MEAQQVYHVDESRMKHLLSESKRRGRNPQKGPGLHRLALSEADMSCREWVRQQMEDAGLEVHVDAALNMHGILRADADKSTSLAPTEMNPRVVTGSHMDSVIGGGHLDGALGVLAGIEALRCIRELRNSGKISLKRSLEVINFTDEEGRFGGMLGSMCIAGGGILSERDVVKMASADSGERIVDLLISRSKTADAGSVSKVQAARDALACAYQPGSVSAYVELHIEQGPVLDANGEELGVVSGICGLWKMEFTLVGQQNHAGTTPMSMRRNAFEGCARVQTLIPELVRKHGSSATVCTIGSVILTPGSPNVVPGKCVFTVEVRDECPIVVEAMSRAVKETVRDAASSFNLEVHQERLMSSMAPVAADPDIMSSIRKHCVRVLNNHPGRYKKTSPVEDVRTMPSGAAHDAQQIGRLAPMGMIFVPSRDGVSHHHSEHTDWPSLQKGCDVLLNVLIELASTTRSSVSRQAPKISRSSTSTSLHRMKTSSEKDPKSALLCIDLQNMPPTTARKGVDFSLEEAAAFQRQVPGLTERVAKAQQKARSCGMEVIHCRIQSRTLDGRDRGDLHKRMGIHVPPGTADWMEGVGPVGDEIVFDKTGSNAFICTSIDHVLRNMGIVNLVCCGVLTDECVSGTVKSACDLGYNCTVLTDACCAATETRHDAALATMSRFVGRMCKVEDWNPIRATHITQSRL